MTNSKNSFVLYYDYSKYVEKLGDEEAVLPEKQQKKKLPKANESIMIMILILRL